jgi:spoIIIJ-associated protein
MHPSLANPDSCWLIIDDLPPEQVQTLIGAEGEVLDAIQYLANAILNLRQGEGEQGVYTVELAGYRARRQAELLALAESAAAQVRERGEEYEMQPLPAAERRLIHTILQESQDLETYSRGEEPNRRLVVRPLPNLGQVPESPSGN